MKNITALLLGIFATVVASMIGLVFLPQWQTGNLAPVTVTTADGDESVYPPEPSAVLGEVAGRGVYRAQGCIYCHSQQVRSAAFGADIDRGWGERRSIPRDYVGQDPPLLGTMRTGPDLANIGQRQPSDAWHHVHLYDARMVSPGSIMPPFKYLYRLTSRNPGVMGIALPSADGVQQWIVPSAEARDLVAYLKALQQAHGLEDVR